MSEVFCKMIIESGYYSSTTENQAVGRNVLAFLCVLNCKIEWTGGSLYMML